MGNLLKNMLKSVSLREVIDILLSIFVFSFIFSFNDWLSIDYGIQRLFYVYVPLVTISLVFRIFLQKYFSNKMRLIMTYELWIVGLIISLSLVFVSNGIIKLVIPGAVLLKFSKYGKIGRNKEGVEISEISKIALYGIWFNIFLAFLFRSIGVMEGVIINSSLALFSLLPIPNVDGIFIFTDSIKKWSGSIVASLLCFVLPFLGDILTLILLIISLALVFLITNYKNI